MPAPIPVELRPYTPEWARAAAREAQRLSGALGENLIVVHHIGSTAIPGMIAKPIVDLLPVVRDLSQLDSSREALEALGYQWWGKYGLPGRRFCTLSGATGCRKVHLHCYQQGTPEIERHLAFRDYLKARPDLARAYESLKKTCRDRHPLDSNAYSDCKHDWIQKVQAEAIVFYRARANSAP